MDLAYDKEQAWIRTLQTVFGLSQPDAIQALERFARARNLRELPEPAQNAGSFDVLATLALPHPSRLLRSSCCPDKDLVIIVSRAGIKDRVSLWKMQGPKRWEVDVDQGLSESEEVVGVAYSPDGQYVLLAHNPPRISLHSLQNGLLERSMNISTAEASSSKLTNLWWLTNTGIERNNEFPDMLKRNGRIPGSAHSLLAILPLLDSNCAKNNSLTTDLFGFNSAPRSSVSNQAILPSSIDSWPILFDDPRVATFAPCLGAGEKEVLQREDFETLGSLTRNTLLLISDDLGNLYFFLNGWFKLGSISMACIPPSSPLLNVRGSSHFITSCYDDESAPLPTVLLRPSTFQLPLLESSDLYEIAQSSSSLRELTWYCKRVIKDMRLAWFGPNDDGARTIGPKWLQSIEEVQRLDWGYTEHRGILELTALLLTGQASQPLTGVLSGGQTMSDRRLTKWESMMSDALITIRDCSETRLYPACQRILLLLEEVRGWSCLPKRYGVFGFQTDDIETMLKHASIAIYLASWLAAKAREELIRFQEFILWLRLETQKAQMHASETTASLIPKHDPLEVNRYLMSGLAASEIDMWFGGTEPDETVLDLFGTNIEPLKDILSKAKASVSSRVQGVSNLEESGVTNSCCSRNLEALLESFASRCCRMFTLAAESVARTVQTQKCSQQLQRSGEKGKPPFIVREKIDYEHDDLGRVSLTRNIVAYVASSTEANILCFLKAQFEDAVLQPRLIRIWVSMHACVPKFMDASKHQYEVLDFDFLDEQHMVVIFRHLNRFPLTGCCPFAALVPWTPDAMKFEPLRAGDRLDAIKSQEDLIRLALRRWKEAQLGMRPLPLKRLHELRSLSRKGGATLSLNGKRQVGCVMDQRGYVEMLDFTKEAEEIVIEDEMEEQ